MSPKTPSLEDPTAQGRGRLRRINHRLEHQPWTADKCSDEECPWNRR